VKIYFRFLFSCCLGAIPFGRVLSKLVKVWLASYIAWGMKGLEILAPIFAVFGYNSSVFWWKKTLWAN